MKVTVKTLQQTNFSLEIEPSETILSVKEKIGQLESKASVIEKQKLIHSGKILVNEKTVEECGIKEGDFLVLMISSTISATKPKETVTNVTNANVTNVEATTSNPVASTSTTTTAATSTSTPAIVTTPQATPIIPNEEAINSICEMGFPREEVIRALKASFNNPDRAVEYLTNGIPEGTTEVDEEEADIVTDAEVSGDLSDNPLAFFLKNPQFAQLRMVVQQDPRLLGPLLEQIAQTNPEIFEMIKENQEAFMELIQTPLTENEMQIIAQSVNELDSEGEEGSVTGGGGGGGDDVDPTSIIQVTEDEQAAIERLMALGFDRPRVIEAYFACDKNETIAANFLFEHMNDDDF